MNSSNRKDRMKWFREARFGMMITWGILSMYPLGRYNWYLPFREFRHLAHKFRPKKGWARRLMELAKKSGARYAVLTTKNDDGYCLFDTKTHDFCAPRTGPGRDLVAEYVEACRKNGIKVGIYYNMGDWRLAMSMTGPDPKSTLYGEHRETLHEQIRELCTSYGPIDLWWWDNFGLPDAKKTIAKMRKWQPNMIFNDRADRDIEGDFTTFEKVIGRPSDPGRMYEICMTSNKHWQYFGPEDNDYMTTREAIHWLISIAGGGGNFILNVGPKSSGDIQPAARKLFEGIGKWLKINGESICGSTDNAMLSGHFAGATARGKATYLHMLFYDRHHHEVFVWAPYCRVTSASVLATGRKLKVRQVGERVTISGLPKKTPDKFDTVIKMTTDVPVETQLKRMGKTTVRAYIEEKENRRSYR